MSGTSWNTFTHLKYVDTVLNELAHTQAVPLFYSCWSVLVNAKQGTEWNIYSQKVEQSQEEDQRKRVQKVCVTEVTRSWPQSLTLSAVSCQKGGIKQDDCLTPKCFSDRTTCPARSMSDRVHYAAGDVRRGMLTLAGCYNLPDVLVQTSKHR